MIKPNSPEFKALQTEWTKKLKDSGFVDIEDVERPDKPLKAWDDRRFKQIPTERRIATERYYDTARELLNTYEFKNLIHKKIWELHCEGLSRRKIAKLLGVFGQARTGEIIGDIAKAFKGES